MHRALLLTLFALLAVPAAATTPPPDAPGPFAVGTRILQVVDASRNRTLPVQAWYPIPTGSVGTPAFYLLQDPLGLTSALALEGPDPLADPFPLIVFSHGSGGINIQSIQLCERLASHGFVVVSPDHVGNTQSDSSAPFDQAALDRPLDVGFLIDHMALRADTVGDPFFDAVDTTRVGVAGHSFGGFTALAAAAGYSGHPSVVVPPDPRVVAIHPIAPASGLITDAELAAIQVPTLVLSGTLDTTTPIDPNTTRIWELVSPELVRRVDIVDATHTHFANICDIANALIGIGLLPQFWDALGIGALLQPYTDTCIPPAFPLTEAQRLQDLYAVSFFRTEVLGDLRYEDFLGRAYALANEPDVIVFEHITTGCGIGFEAALVLLPLAVLHRRRSGRTGNARG
jgi:predicted dienelactone hydrolase